VADFLTRFFDIEGKVAAMTGAGGHLVGGISKELARAGVKVAVMDVRFADAEKRVDELREIGTDAIPLRVDVTKKQELESALQAVLDHFGELHFVMNGAGINSPTPFLATTLEEWDQVIASQLTGTMLACQVFGAHLLARGRGSIINVSSASAGPPLSNAFPYSAAKAAIVNLTQNLAREWAPHGVRVNCIRPGFFPTAWNRKNFITPEREAAILAHTPMGRFGDPVEVAGAAIWLFSEAAGFVTGAEIAVDGGFAAMTV
jgi:NAD(P)-dependent dehydrogenase (short-subunit alcohol dehydrogenase family)